MREFTTVSFGTPRDKFRNNYDYGVFCFRDGNYSIKQLSGPRTEIMAFRNASFDPRMLHFKGF